jgi:hypothetical protein
VVPDAKTQPTTSAAEAGLTVGGCFLFFFLPPLLFFFFLLKFVGGLYRNHGGRGAPPLHDALMAKTMARQQALEAASTDRYHIYVIIIHSIKAHNISYGGNLAFGRASWLLHTYII